MPFNGAGQFSLIYNWQTDAANGLNISSSRMQGQNVDIASGLSLCMTKDGQQTAIANLPMGGFTFTNLALATALKNPVTVQDLQNGTPTWVGTVSGTDTITGAANIAPAAYVAGQKWRGITAGTNLTNTVTMNFNGLGAISVSGLPAGAFGAGQIFEVTYDGTHFQLDIPQPSGIVPIGGIIMWSGAANAIPLNWHLCDGTVGTPNLEGQFVIGAGGTYAVGATGGSATALLNHVHAVTDGGHNHGITDPQHTHATTYDNTTGGGSPTNNGLGSPTNIQNQPASTGITINNSVTGILIQQAGNGATSLPPYYALCYIMRTA